MIVLAPGITFDKEKHEYYYRGVKLSGVTCRVMYTSITRAKKALYFTGLKGNVNSDYITSLI